MFCKQRKPRNYAEINISCETLTWWKEEGEKQFDKLEKVLGPLLAYREMSGDLNRLGAERAQQLIERAKIKHAKHLEKVATCKVRCVAAIQRRKNEAAEKAKCN